VLEPIEQPGFWHLISTFSDLCYRRLYEYSGTGTDILRGMDVSDRGLKSPCSLLSEAKINLIWYDMIGIMLGRAKSLTSRTPALLSLASTLKQNTSNIWCRQLKKGTWLCNGCYMWLCKI